MEKSHGKRAYSSPKENMSKRIVDKPTPQKQVTPQAPPQVHETAPEKLVKIELLTLNDKPYLGQVSEDELIYIWTRVLNKKIEDLFGVTSSRTLNRNIRATFKLKAPIKIQDAFDGPDFAYEKFLDDGSSERITGKILGFNNAKAVEIGELTKITVKTNLGVEASGVLNWLKLYGTVTTSGHHDFRVSETSGLRTDVFEAEIVLKKHVEEYLPMYGQKTQVYYPGIPRMCNRCYTSGHLRRECGNQKKDWIAHVRDLVRENKIDKELIGTWSAAIARWKSANRIVSEDEA
jgi:hypothetical protein